MRNRPQVNYLNNNPFAFRDDDNNSYNNYDDPDYDPEDEDLDYENHLDDDNDAYEYDQYPTDSD